MDKCQAQSVFLGRDGKMTDPSPCLNEAVGRAGNGLLLCPQHTDDYAKWKAKVDAP